MEPLVIQPTADTPGIRFDAEENVFEISDTSWPEDAAKFYAPVVDWLEEYFKMPNKYTLMEFKMRYFNTSSAKQFARILGLLQSKSTQYSIKVLWYYENDDREMLKAGQRFSKLIGVDFETISLANSLI